MACSRWSNTSCHSASPSFNPLPLHHFMSSKKNPPAPGPLHLEIHVLLRAPGRPVRGQHQTRKFALEHSRTHNIPLRSIDPAFLDALRRYHWPGNVREMENVIRRAVLYCHRGVLTLGDLPSSIRAAVAGVSTSFSSSAVSLAPTPYPTRDAESQFQGPIPGGMGALLPQDSFGGTMQRGGYRPSLPFVPPPPAPYAMSQGGEEPRQQSAGVASAASATGGGASPAASLEARVDVMERRIIEDCLKRNNFRRKETAAELGISRVTLYNKMKKYGML